MGHGVSVCCFSSGIMDKEEVERGSSGGGLVLQIPAGPALTFGIMTPNELQYTMGDDCTASTPVKSDDKEKFRYYCPMCFVWWKDSANMLSTSCCSNNLCVLCTVDFLASKHIEVRGRADILANVDSHHFHQLHCPHCASDGFRPCALSALAPPRSYFNTPAKEVNMYDGQAPRASPDSVAAMQPDLPLSMASPLKVGHSLEVMRPKMTQMPCGGVAPASHDTPVTPTAERVVQLALGRPQPPSQSEGGAARLDPSLPLSPQKLGFQLQSDIQLHSAALRTFACQFVDALISSNAASASSTAQEAQERNTHVLAQ